MNESIQIAIISAGLAALINCLFQLVNKLIDNAKERRVNTSKELATYKKKKKKPILLLLADFFKYGVDLIIHVKCIINIMNFAIITKK